MADGDNKTKSLDQLHEETSKALDALKTQLQTDGAKLLERTAKQDTDTAELKKSVDKVLTEKAELSDRLAEIEKKITRKAGPGELEDADMDAGQLFAKAIESDPALKERLANPHQGAPQINVAFNRKALTNSGVTGAALTYPGMALPLLRPLVRRLTIRDLLAQGRTSMPVIFYPRETGFTNAAAIVSEGSLKPESDFTFDMVTANVVTIANTQRVSLQMLADIPALQSYINGRMTYGLKLIEEGELLTGSGTGGHLNGIYTQATAYNTALDAGVNAATETDIDKIRLAMLQVELAFAEVTGIVLHPTQWAGIELLKDSQGRYIWANPTAQNGATLWGRSVVATQAMTSGKFLVGDFAMHAQIFDREDANVAISFEDRDNFVRNMATIRVEERLALAVYRPAAFVKGTLESASH